jgi:hypothetical protein
MVLSRGLSGIDSRCFPIIRVTLAIRRIPVGLLWHALISSRLVVMLIAMPLFIFALFHDYLLIDFKSRRPQPMRVCELNESGSSTHCCGQQG